MYLCGFTFLKTASPFLAPDAFTVSVCIPDIGNIIWLSSCARLSAIRFGLSVTVADMNDIVSGIGLAGCYGFITNCRWASV